MDVQIKHSSELFKSNVIIKCCIRLYSYYHHRCLYYSTAGHKPPKHFHSLLSCCYFPLLIRLLLQLFTACLQEFFKKFGWKNKGTKVGSEYLCNLWVADNILIFGDTNGELQIMIEELNRESLKADGQQKSRIQQRRSTWRNNHPEGRTTNSKWICILGSTKQTTPSLDPEIKGRLRVGWSAFGQQSNILRGSFSMSKVKSFSSVSSPLWFMDLRHGHWPSLQKGI